MGDGDRILHRCAFPIASFIGDDMSLKYAKTAAVNHSLNASIWALPGDNRCLIGYSKVHDKASLESKLKMFSEEIKSNQSLRVVSFTWASIILFVVSAYHY